MRNFHVTIGRHTLQYINHYSTTCNTCLMCTMYLWDEKNSISITFLWNIFGVTAITLPGDRNAMNILPTTWSRSTSSTTTSQQVSLFVNKSLEHKKFASHFGVQQQLLTIKIEEATKRKLQFPDKEVIFWIVYEIICYSAMRMINLTH